MRKQVLLSVCFRIQGKEKQKIHFANANTNNEKKCQCHIMIYESFQSLLKDDFFKAKLSTNSFSSRYEPPYRIFQNTFQNTYWAVPCFVIFS